MTDADLLAKATDMLTEDARTIGELRARIREAIALLRDLEWRAGGGALAGLSVCPCCEGALEHDGHAPDCRLNALLKGAA